MSIVCNVVLAVLLLLLVSYSRGGSAASGGRPSQSVVETVEPIGPAAIESLPETGISKLPNESRENRGAEDPTVVPDWKTLDFPRFAWRSFVFESGESQKLSAVTIHALAMTPEEVAEVEALASRLAGKLEELKRIHEVRDDHLVFDDLQPMVWIPEAELDVLCDLFSQGARECLGNERGKVLADAVLLSRSFLVGAYSGVDRSYRIRKWKVELRSKVPDAFPEFGQDFFQRVRIAPVDSESSPMGDPRFMRTYREGQP